MSGANIRFLDEKLYVEKDYWSKKLAGHLPVAGIPIDFARPPTFSDERRAVRVEASRETTQRLLQVCGESDAMVFTVLVTALTACLYKYTGINDIIVGTAIHERYREVASFNKVLALRSQITEQTTLRQLLEDLKATLSGAYANQKYPFERLLELVNNESPGNRAPLFNVVIVSESINDSNNIRHLRNDVTLIFSKPGANLSGAIEYNACLFKKSTIEAFGEHYIKILSAILERPSTTISDIELLSSEEREALVFQYNATSQPFPEQSTIHELIEKQAASLPTAVAVRQGREEITYDVLDRRANQLARYLQSLGVRRGETVGLCMHHSMETLIALLGVLKAGAAYVPIDPFHPESRIKFVLEDASIRVLLTEESLRDRLPDFSGTMLSVDSWRKEIADQSEAKLEAEAGPEDLAYVIYTSGSTGQPKGVKIQHRALVNYIWWAKDAYLRGDRLNFALYSSLAFDLTVTSIFTPLVTGNKIVVYRREDNLPPLDDILRDNQVGVLKLTPSHLSLIKDMPIGQSPVTSQICRMIVGGEAFEVELARRICKNFGGKLEIFNEYGPTEATVGCMIHRFEPESDDLAFVPIGRPAANMAIYVLDEKLHPVPKNIIGEIYISGVGLALGYLNRDDLTNDRFIPNPFVPGAKMYRSGDLARWLPEGKLEYFGRRDEQVKYHGHRIELNELRCALNGHPQIRDSVVLLLKDRNERDVLVAYYVSRTELDVAELRAFLSRLIIQETIPNLFVHLKRLPLTLNGKINHQALPTLEEARAKIKRAYIAPRNEIEQKLAAIWEQVLGVKQVGIQDNFFELGGHSLLAAQVVAMVRETFQANLQLRSLFETSTLEDFGRRVVASQMPGRDGSELTIRHIAGTDDLPLSFAQRRLWFLNHLNPESGSYNINMTARLTGQLSRHALSQAINEVVRRHETLRSIFLVENGQPKLGIQPGLRPSLILVDLNRLKAHEQQQLKQRITNEETQRPFDLETGPLLRTNLIQFGADSNVIQITMHHIVSDGVSVQLFAREVMHLYEAFRDGSPSSLIELAIQYADYARWERETMQPNLIEPQLDYWVNHLKNAHAVVASSNKTPPASVSDNAATYRFKLGRQLSESVSGFSRAREVSLFMVTLAMLKALLHRYSGEDQIKVGTPLSRRDRTETQEMIGCMLNTVALSTDLSDNPTLVELLERVRVEVIGGQANQDVPFEMVVEALGLNRREEERDLFEVWFSLEQGGWEGGEMGGVMLEEEEVDISRGQFAMTMMLRERAGELEGRVIYSRGSYDEETIAEMVEGYVRIIEQMVERAETRVLDVELAVDSQGLQENPVDDDSLLAQFSVPRS